jgi:hypothetical protein
MNINTKHSSLHNLDILRAYFGGGDLFLTSLTEPTVPTLVGAYLLLSAVHLVDSWRRLAGSHTPELRTFRPDSQYLIMSLCQLA